MLLAQPGRSSHGARPRELLQDLEIPDPGGCGLPSYRLGSTYVTPLMATTNDTGHCHSEDDNVVLILVETAKVLLNAGADVQAADLKGYTPPPCRAMGLLSNGFAEKRS